MLRFVLDLTIVLKIAETILHNLHNIMDIHEVNHRVVQRLDLKFDIADILGQETQIDQLGGLLASYLHLVNYGAVEVAAWKSRTVTDFALFQDQQLGFLFWSENYLLGVRDLYFDVFGQV